MTTLAVLMNALHLKNPLLSFGLAKLFHIPLLKVKSLCAFHYRLMMSLVRFATIQTIPS
jgi:hypothetical protein